MPHFAGIHTPEFWKAAPAYDSYAFWVLACQQAGEVDSHGRDLLIIGHGAAGPIRCTREYGENRRHFAKQRTMAERMKRRRAARKADAAPRAA